MIAPIFWGLVVLDLAGVLLWFTLGLAAAGSAGTSPVRVVLLLLVLPLLLLGLVTLLYLRGGAPEWRLLAVLLAAAPLVTLASLRLVAQVQFRGAMNAEGEMTFFRDGPHRELAEAIARNDTAQVATLAATIDLNRGGLSGMTPLMLAMRQLRRTPDQQEVLRTLLQAGADPNLGAQSELPLAIAIQVAGTAGTGPVIALLEAGADPNLVDEFGRPVFFAGVGHSVTPETMAPLLDHGAAPDMVARGGQSVLVAAALVGNWPVALLLLERGADPSVGRNLDGLTFAEMVERVPDEAGADGALLAIRQRVRR